MAYRVVLPKSAQKDLDRLEEKQKQRIMDALFVLQDNPLIGKKLQGSYVGMRSYAVWPYRIVCQIMQPERIVLIVRVGHRQGVYR